MTVAKAVREADDLLRDANGEDARLLQEAKTFIYTLADRYGAA